MGSQSFWYEVYTTFVASIRSVGTACTLAAVGVYLHRRGFVVGDGKKTLALISQQVTIPLFLFSKIIYCNQDWSDEPCPDVTKNLNDIWALLWWPAYVVGCGLLVGYVAARVSNTQNVKACMAACAFGNSTGLPITLLSVVHANFPSTTELGAVDPTLFLSVYLLLYPVLQWGVGGWLLAPEEEEETDNFPNVLNNDAMEDKYRGIRRGLSETDASMYISEMDLVRFHRESEIAEAARRRVNSLTPGAGLPVMTEESSLLDSARSDGSSTMYIEEKGSTNGNTLLIEETTNGGATHIVKAAATNTFHSVRDTLHKIASRCLQPPVVGAMLGLFVAATPLRGIFVDVVDRSSDAPLQWFFDGLYHVGQAAVPLNMMILGCNLSASHFGSSEKLFLSTNTMLAIVVGKMLVMPVIGIVSAIVCDKYLLDVPESINASFYLVAMIVFITPTANNVMVMVELSGSGAKEAMAQVIAWQYAVSPLILSLTMTVAVGVASQWS